MVHDNSQSNFGRPTTPIPKYILSDNAIESVPNLSSQAPKSSSEIIEKLKLGLESVKRKFGNHHIDVAVALDAMASAYSDNKEYNSALRYFNDALEIKKKSLHKHHPSIADSLRYRGDVLYKMGLMNDSEESYKAASDGYRNGFDDRSWLSPGTKESKQQIDFDLHQMVAKTLVHRGMINYENKDYEKAMVHYKEALKEARMSAVDAVVLDRHQNDDFNKSLLDVSFLQETRIFISVIMNNIANVFALLNDRPNAIMTYNAALALQIEEVGEDHLSVSCTLHNMGTMHFQHGELNLSLKCYKQVLKMRRMLLGNEHSSIADALMNLAIVHEKAGEFDRAESALNASLRVVKKVYDEDDMRVAFVESCLGALHARNGSDVNALDSFERALEICKSARLDDDHPLVLSTERSMEYVRRRNKDIDSEQLMVKNENVDGIMNSLLICGGGFCFTSYDGVDVTNLNKGADMSVLV